MNNTIDYVVEVNGEKTNIVCQGSANEEKVLSCYVKGIGSQKKESNHE